MCAALCGESLRNIDTNLGVSGPPGVGKTLTAELLSEHLQKPLYHVRFVLRSCFQYSLMIQISAGDLGTTTDTVEARLRRIFERASRWQAVLLLDEADVFLEQRSSSDLVRNAIVSVFLRTLEYYRGIMFLTTNRVAHIDDAIASRIHCKLRYASLGQDQRRDVWKQCLDRADAKCTLLDWDWESLADNKLNGREVGFSHSSRRLLIVMFQIKNTVSIAHALALQEGTQLEMSHVETALDVNASFERDFRRAGRIESMQHYA